MNNSLPSHRDLDDSKPSTPNTPAAGESAGKSAGESGSSAANAIAVVAAPPSLPNLPNGSLTLADVLDEEQDESLTGPQRLALEWLISGGSITEAAQFAGVCRQTVSRWLSDDFHFSDAYDRWRQHVLRAAEGRMLTLTDAALDNLTTAIREKRDLHASQFLLKQIRRGANSSGERSMLR